MRIQRERSHKMDNIFISEIAAPVAGRAIPLSEVEDEIFAAGIIGKGIAIEPSDGRVYSPADGTVNHFCTKHAIGIFSDIGAELLIHIGIDTVKLGGMHYNIIMQEGAKVKKGDLLATFDISGIKEAGYKTITPIVICNSAAFKEINTFAADDVQAGDILIEAVRIY